MYRYAAFLTITAILFFACKSQNSSNQNSDHKYTNHLVKETSPYLLQHAHNPVDWHPWNDETLAKAEKEDKMILVSVGYAACHWCHVMEHESFEDSTVAKIMNENFINIKVDREERPDVDDVYMTACHLSNNRSCGWPLNSVALPDGRPVWAGTYFPKKDWMNVLTHFRDAYKSDKAGLVAQAEKITNGIKRSENIIKKNPDDLVTEQNLGIIVDDFLANIDMKRGGRNGQPKFPMPNNYNFLMEYESINTHLEAKAAVKVTLDNMAMGGIYDQIGGGFARYSVDNKWLVPHFEKMLYDNGQLLSLYSKAYLKTKDKYYEEVINGVVDFAKRDLMSKEGGFYSSWDADSEGEEGLFYIWSKAELDSILNDASASKVFNDYYNITKKGNWEHGHNIPHITAEKSKFIKKHGITMAAFDELIGEAKTKIFKARKNRVHPGLDDKILTSWNSLMLKGLTDAYVATQDKNIYDLALKNAKFIKKNMVKDDFRLDRNYKNGKSNINGFLDDYVNTVDAFLGVYEMTWDKEWLFLAHDLHKYAQTHFKDDNSDFFFYTSDLDKQLIARKKELSDNVIPASNSVMAHNFHRLGLYFYNDEYVAHSKSMLNSMLTNILDTKQPNFYSNWCNLLSEFVKPTFEIAVVGDDAPDIANKLKQSYIPNAIIVAGGEDAYVELLADRYNKGETSIYVCQNKICKFPVDTVEEALKLLGY